MLYSLKLSVKSIDLRALILFTSFKDLVNSREKLRLLRQLSTPVVKENKMAVAATTTTREQKTGRQMEKADR